jgi:choline-sulfatase
MWDAGDFTQSKNLRNRQSGERSVVSIHTLHAVIGAIALAVLGCSRVGKESKPQLAERPSILLITLDTTRADRLGSYGFKIGRTPRLDELAKQGVRVAHAIAAAPITAPAHSSILTGLLPPAHGVRDNGTYRLPDEVETLPEVLKREGYATAAFVSAAVLDRQYNLCQGFDTYDDDLWSEDAPPMFMIRERAGARTVALATEWLERQHERRPDQPFFVWVHLFDAHEPHSPAAFDTILAPSRYDAEIAGLDRQVGALIDAVSALQPPERTLIALTADHGESLEEHGETTHGIFVYESTVRIPMLLRWPGKLPPSVYPGPMHQVDLFPTLLAATHSKVPANQGLNLLDALAGKISAPEHALYSESKLSELGFGMAPLHAVRLGPYTYVRAPKPELYDRSKDPQELDNLIEREPEIARQLSAELDRLLQDSESRGYHAPEQSVDRATEETLRALGYVGDTQTRKAVTAMDPKDGIAMYEQLNRARHLVRSARYAEAIEVLHELLTRTPRNSSALNVLALSEYKAGNPERAEQIYRDSLRAEANQPRVHLQLANMLLDKRHYDTALAEAQEALRQSPQFVEALIVLGFSELRRGNKVQADEYYNRALQADPKYPRAFQAYADMFFRQQDYAQALDYYRKALQRAPNNFESLIQAGVSARRSGDINAALGFYETAAQLRPDSWIPPYNVACLHALAGDRAAALEQLGRAVQSTMSDPDLLLHDADLASLREDPQFLALTKQAQRKARPNR